MGVIFGSRTTQHRWKFDDSQGDIPCVVYSTRMSTDWARPKSSRHRLWVVGIVIIVGALAAAVWHRVPPPSGTAGSSPRAVPVAVTSAETRDVPNAFDEYFMIAEPSGVQFERLDVLARNRSTVSGAALVELANAVWQVIWGEFTAVLPQEDAIRVTIRAIDSTFYEVTTTDDAVLHKIKSTYKDVRVAPGPATSTPIPLVPRKGDQEHAP